MKLWGLCPEGRYWFLAQGKEEMIAVYAWDEGHAQELAKHYAWKAGEVSVCPASITEVSKYGLKSVKEMGWE